MCDSLENHFFALLEKRKQPPVLSSITQVLTLSLYLSHSNFCSYNFFTFRNEKLHKTDCFIILVQIRDTISESTITFHRQSILDDFSKNRVLLAFDAAINEGEGRLKYFWMRQFISFLRILFVIFKIESQTEFFVRF
jgi:hypothetical protein